MIKLFGDSGSDLAPTTANYQIAASQSLEKLDELLIRQGNKPLSPAPICTASALVLANASREALLPPGIPSLVVKTARRQASSLWRT